MTDQAVRELAAKAAAELRRRGWVQRDYADWRDDSSETCAVCAFGAIIAAEGGDPHWDTAYDTTETGQLLGHAFAEHIGRPTLFSEVFGYNDAEGRTAEEVIGVFDKIANAA